MYSAKISIVIPVYNAEKTLGNILEKLITQSYQNIEIITVNDGSEDDSWKILQEYSKKDRRIITIKQKNNGASAARNVGIGKSTGEFITFIDSDDDISEDLVSVLANYVTSSSDFIMCGMMLNGKEIISSDVTVEGKKEVVQYVLKSLLTKNLLYGPYCKLFRRKLVVDNKIEFPVDVRYGEDTIFVLNYLSNVNNLRTINKSLYTYQITETGLASTNNSILEYRKARSKALSVFVGDSSGLYIMTVYSLLKLRWCIAYFKSFILRIGK